MVGVPDQPDGPSDPQQPDIMAIPIEKKFKPKTVKYKSEWTGSLFDLDRMDKMLRAIDVFSFQFYQRKPEFIRPMYAGLVTLFVNLRPFLRNWQKKEWDKVFAVIGKSVFEDKDKMNTNNFENLANLHKDINQLRFEIGVSLRPEPQADVYRSLKKRMRATGPVVSLATGPTDNYFKDVLADGMGKQ